MNDIDRSRMDVVIAGHVDHGKSTVIGRMLADTNALPDGKLEQVKENCRKNSKPFEYAFLLDALKDEQSQGITIDSARVFFKTEKRDYIIIDAPGHIEFLKNMVTGASRSEAAILVIDAEEGVQENSKRHGYLLGMLGIKQMFVVVNKMDLVRYDKEVFEKVVKQYSEFLKNIGLSGIFIPASGMKGDNISLQSNNMQWYTGPTVLEAMENFQKEPLPIEKPFRMPVQDVYKFTKSGDKRRIVVGTAETGQLEEGDEVIFYPSGKRSRVKTIEAFNNGKQSKISAGHACAFTLDEQIYIHRGQLAVKDKQLVPKVTTKLKVSLFWMGKEPLVKNKDYHIKIGTAKEKVTLDEVVRVIDGSSLDANEKADQVSYHDVAECVLSTTNAIAFDLADDLAVTSRFVIIDDYEIRGGGIIRQALDDKQEWVREYVMTRNYKWETGSISKEDRAERYNQKASLILVTGSQSTGKKTLSKVLEARLFGEGKIIYFLGIGNILYGVDADIKVSGKQGNRDEHLRRVAEVANLMLDAGVILVVTAVDLTQNDYEIVRTALDTDNVYVVWLGEKTTDINHDLILPARPDLDSGIDSIKNMLQQTGAIFKP